MLRSLAILTSGIAVSAAIYLKPIEKPDKFAAVLMADGRFVIVDNGSMRHCMTLPLAQATDGLISEKGIQHFLGVSCGHAYITNTQVVDLSSQTGMLAGLHEPKSTSSR